MNDTLKTTATALLISASLGLAACQSEVPLGEGLARAQGGPCVQGQLNTFAATPTGAPLTLDGQSAYWLQSDGVGPLDAQTLILMRVDESGGAPVAMASGIVDGGFLVGDQDVEWMQENYDPLSNVLTSQTVWSVPKAGGSPTPIAHSTAPLGRLAASDADRFYFIGPYPADSAKVLSMPRSGGAVTVMADMLVPGAPPDLKNLDYDEISQVVLDDANLYWSYEGQVFSLAKTGAAPVVLASGANVTWFVQDAERLYWIDVNRDLFSVAKSGGPVTTMAQGLPARGDLVTDGVCLYMITADTSSPALIAVPNAGGTPVVVADIPLDLSTGVAPAADATGYYVTDYDSGKTLKLAR